MTKKVQNINFNKAKTSKQNEFYTQLSDIEKELEHYKKHFTRKIFTLRSKIAGERGVRRRP